MDCRYSKNQEHDKKICKVFGGGGVLSEANLFYAHLGKKMAIGS